MGPGPAQRLHSTRMAQLPHASGLQALVNQAACLHSLGKLYESSMAQPPHKACRSGVGSTSCLSAQPGRAV